MRRFGFVVVATTVMIGSLTGSASATGTRYQGTFRPQSHPFGIGYPEWAVRFQQWTVLEPAFHNPLLDPTGRKCGKGQSGPVWFLTSALGFSGNVVRDECTVPSNKALLLPIGTSACVPTEKGDTAKKMAQCVRDITAGITGLEASIDGVPIDVAAFGVETPVFTLTLGQRNVYGLPPGAYRPTVAGGYYVILRPLSPGPHTVHFTATYAGSSPATIDVTYHLTVVAPN